MRPVIVLPITYCAIACLLLPAAEPVIGLAASQGRMEVDRAAVDGNASLVNGASIRTLDSPVRIRLSNGNGATIGPASEARIFSDHLALSRGQSLLTTPNYRAEALGFTAAGSRASIEVRGAAVQVAALNGPVQVTDGKGVVIARVLPGAALSFEPSATQGISTMTGALRRDTSKFFLKDELTNLDVELRGSNLDRYAGRRVRVTGTADRSSDGKSQVILVSRLAAAGPQQTGGNRPDTSSGGNRPDTETKPAKQGMSNGAKIAIVAVIAGGAAGGILAATGKSSTSASR